MKTPKLLTALIYWIFLITAGSAYAETPTLTVFTYSSFTSEWGPGPLIKKAYETRCQCNLKFVGLEDGAALLSRLKLEGNRTSADVVLGLDTSLIAEAQATELLAPHGLNTDAIDLAVKWSDPYFLPYDFGYFGYIVSHGLNQQQFFAPFGLIPFPNKGILFFPNIAEKKSYFKNLLI